jgi:pimeloyl-ACP methyl ester carboxylesterase
MKNGLHTIHITDYDATFLKFGEGPRPAVFIPGLAYVTMPAQVERRREYAANYAPEFTCYFIERRSNLTAGCTTRQMASDVYDFICALDLGKVYVEGTSQGGMIAQWLAIDFPEVVEKLVLTVTLSRPNEEIKTTSKWLEVLKTQGGAAALEVMAKDAYSTRYLEEHGGAPIEAPPAEFARPLDQYEILQKACLTHNSYDELNKIQCPTFVIGGWKDRIVSGMASVDIAEKLNCDLHMCDELGHALDEEDPLYHKRVKDWFLKA